MVKKTKEVKTSKTRTQVKKLSKSGKSLTTAETKNVKGGLAKEYHKVWEDGFLK